MAIAKNSRINRARATKATAGKAEAKDRVIQIAIPEGVSAEEAKITLAKSISGWGDLTQDQQTELAEIVAAQRRTPAPVKVTLTRKPDGGNSIGLAGNCEALGLFKLQQAFAATTMDPVDARASELLRYLGSVGAASETRYNAALAFVESMAPQDQAEALLLVQMYVTHDAAIRALSQLGTAELVPHMQTFGNLATKLLRVSQGQMETLARMRRGGEQVVKHIHVDNRGGQAIVTDTIMTGGANEKSADQSHATGTTGIGPALLGANPFGYGVPISSSEGTEAVSYARGDQPGRA